MDMGVSSITMIRLILAALVLPLLIIFEKMHKLWPLGRRPRIERSRDHHAPQTTR
jgi:hypothetical protein